MAGERRYEFRCPIHGFVSLSAWERDIISLTAYQRLRRIRQLAWTDQVYPGAMHTRFEHSLGVMHTATRLYDSVRRNSAELLEREGYKEGGLERDQVLVRLAALLHDVGHGPFSHAAEDLMPQDAEGVPLKHEAYSAAIIRSQFREVIENDQTNQRNYRITAEDVASFVEGTYSGPAAFWRDILSGQADADRMDYLLRDSFHSGVSYGTYDLERLIQTACAIPPDGETGLRLGFTEGGGHAAESLVVARYLMFTQVYFHKTRVAYDHHLRMALRELLPEGVFPAPSRLAEYLDWDDWRVLGLIQSGSGGEHALRLCTRDHYREVYHTPEAPTDEDQAELEAARERLGSLLAAEETARKSWYALKNGDIPLLRSFGTQRVIGLSRFSSIAERIEPVRKVSLYVRREDKAEAARLIAACRG